MTYFDTRDVAAITLSAALWGVINGIFSPIVFRMFGLPFLCDLIGFTVLTVTIWWTRKLGAATTVGVVATAINFILNPAGVQFLGFTAASVVFDIAARSIGYDSAFRRMRYSVASMVPISTLSAAVAGYLIGTFFMVAPGGALGWAAIHGVGGVIGGTIGAVLVNGLTSRGILVKVHGQRVASPAS